jgi:CBS domain-containing protein
MAKHFKPACKLDTVSSVGRKRKRKATVLEPVHPERLLKVKVKEVMNRRPRAVNPETSIDGLIERLRGQIEDCFPVIDKKRKLVGIVTESDVLQVLRIPMRRIAIGRAGIREVMKRHAATVGEIMTKRPITTTPNMSLQETLNIMAAHKLRHLPVVEKGRLVGLICLRDIIELYHVLR